ncbi:MAG: hypothetical protein ACK5IQ_10135 [Bacteroidales bacterium]
MKIFNVDAFKASCKNDQCIFMTDDGTEVRQCCNKNGYDEIVQLKDSIWEYFYEYFPEKLKSSIKRYPNLFVTGYLKKYNQERELIRQEGLDKPFVYSCEDVMICIRA